MEYTNIKSNVLLRWLQKFSIHVFQVCLLLPERFIKACFSSSFIIQLLFDSLWDEEPGQYG